jgi:hypothetical protein
MKLISECDSGRRIKLRTRSVRSRSQYFQDLVSAQDDKRYATDRNNMSRGFENERLARSKWLNKHNDASETDFSLTFLHSSATSKVSNSSSISMMSAVEGTGIVAPRRKYHNLVQCFPFLTLTTRSLRVFGFENNCVKTTGLMCSLPQSKIF